MAKALRAVIYLVTIDEHSDLKSEVFGDSNSFYQGTESTRLPLLFYRSTFNVMYTLKQANQLRTFSKKLTEKTQPAYD